MRCRYLKEAGYRSIWDCTAGNTISISGDDLDICFDNDKFVTCNRFQMQYAIENPPHELKTMLEKDISLMSKKVDRIEKLFKTIEVTVERISSRLDKLEDIEKSGFKKEDNL